ncbi:hypothetical protein FHL15_010157 [Xylaria flabelliformis]|uniref:Uncharacterized protein n=1 Tax=Xylaria flabelliformis TaxID=2512241 RepID=A0A553HLU7_9PEZI|nr:hypothetical protein FHL15_010157 [Xylaria flabelliformis]
MLDNNEYDSFDDSDEENDYPEMGNSASFELSEMIGGDAQDHGALKSFETKDGSLIYWKDDKTYFTISVERLLQADGYADSTKQQRLTLFVLKIVLACNSDSRIKRAVFNMNFEDMPEKSNNAKTGNAMVKPEIMAWAPFDSMDKNNQIEAKKMKKRKGGLEFGGGGAGVDAKGMTEYESSIEWTATYWETGHSFPTFGGDQTRTGVRWVLNANPKDTQGLPPKLIVGILLSRHSDEPYLANFDINVTGGFFHDLRKGIEKTFGRKPDVTKPYKVQPSKEPIWLATGLKMMNRINLGSMMDLQGKGEDLVLVWNNEEEGQKKNFEALGEDGAAVTLESVASGDE